MQTEQDLMMFWLPRNFPKLNRVAQLWMIEHKPKPKNKLEFKIDFDL